MRAQRLYELLHINATNPISASTDFTMPPKRKVTPEEDDELKYMGDNKRAQTTTSAEKEEEEANFQMAVKMHARFSKYPDRLRLTIERSCKTAFHTYMSTLLNGTPTKVHQIYSVMIGTRMRSDCLAFTTQVHQANILDLNIANTVLLEMFANKMKRTMLNPAFVELPTQEGLSNPEFIELYSVRHGELGWGLDEGGCVSFYKTSVVEKKLKEQVWYVRKGGIKVEA